MPKGKLTASESTPIGVRLTMAQRAKLDSLARSCGIEVSHLIRFGIDALITHYHANGDRLVLPIDFSEVVTAVKNTASQPEKKAQKTKQ